MPMHACVQLAQAAAASLRPGGNLLSMSSGAAGGRAARRACRQRADFVPPGAIPPGIWTAADVVEMSDCGYEEVYGRCICEQFVMYLSGYIIF